MNQRNLLKAIGSGAVMLALALILILMFGRQTDAQDNIEPLDDYMKNQLRGTGLDFIAETGRILVDEDGRREIIWDLPQLPTLEESIRMTAQAMEIGDESLIPLCTDRYVQYLKA